MNILDKETKKKAEKLWSYYKYEILSKSQQHYQYIRNYLKKEVIDLDKLKNIIEITLNLDDDNGQCINAFEHIWGYFKKEASIEEKINFFKKIELYKNSKLNKTDILDYLKILLKKYPNKYLENSSILINLKD